MYEYFLKGKGGGGVFLSLSIDVVDTKDNKH